MELKTEADTAQPATAPLSPRERVMEMIGGFWGSQICGTTARLRLADHLLDGPRTVSELATLTAADADGLGRLLRACATIGLCTEMEGDRFELTALGAELADGDVSGSLRDQAIAFTSPNQWLPYGRLFDAVVSAQPQDREALGMDVWAYLESHGEERSYFARAMGSLSAEASGLVVRRYDVSRYRRIVDVGGSEGVLLAALLTAAPSATGVLFDLPEVIAGARQSLAGDRAQRIELIGGDFFEEVPAGGDLYILKQVLHDWDDDRALRILRNIHRASAPGATLAVIEQLLPSEPAPSYTHLLNLLMLVVAGGRERTLEDYRALFHQAGYRVERTIPTPGSTVPWNVVEAIRQ